MGFLGYGARERDGCTNNPVWCHPILTIDAPTSIIPNIFARWRNPPNLSFPTGQCTGSPCSWNHRAAVARDTRFYSTQPELWPPNSIDLNPVDYMVWGVMEQHVYQSRVNTVDKLKECLTVVWSNFWQDILDTVSGENISRHMSVQMEDILNIFCEQPLAVSAITNKWSAYNNLDQEIQKFIYVFECRQGCWCSCGDQNSNWME